MGREIGNSCLVFVFCLCEDRPLPNSGWWQAMSRRILLAIASAVTAGLLAVLVTAIELVQVSSPSVPAAPRRHQRISAPPMRPPEPRRLP